MFIKSIKNEKLEDVLLLGSGMVLTFLTHVQYGIGFLAWFAYVPFLLYVRKTKSLISRVILFFALFIAWFFATAKIVTAPMSIAMAAGFGFIIGSVSFIAMLIWSFFKEKKFAFLIFPAAMVILEWIQYRWSPFASWGSVVYTQINNLPLAQSVSLLGLSGLGFLMYSVNSIIEESISKGFQKRKAIVTGTVIVALMAFGYLRMALAETEAREMVKVAAIGTDYLDFTQEITPELIEHHAEVLFDRTRTAAASGAQLIVWNEVATVVLDEDENEWLSNLSGLADELNVDIAAGYGIPIFDDQSGEFAAYENKYAMLLADGTLDHTYIKHEPVFGEPSVRGTEPQQVADMGFAMVGGAICYDYDYPYLARGNARLGADIVAVPSSDWRGIDPIHTQMAAFRAIESGTSVVRSTRAGLSAAIDPIGRMISKMSYFDSDELIMIGTVPVESQPTLYRIVGDIFVFIATGLLIFAAAYPKQ